MSEINDPVVLSINDNINEVDIECYNVCIVFIKNILMYMT